MLNLVVSALVFQSVVMEEQHKVQLQLQAQNEDLLNLQMSIKSGNKPRCLQMQKKYCAKIHDKEAVPYISIRGVQLKKKNLLRVLFQQN